MNANEVVLLLQVTTVENPALARPQRETTCAFATDFEADIRDKQ
jgi:hypothetical protein